MTTFKNSALAARLFAPLIRANLVATKRQEIKALAALSPAQALGLYLDIV
ncbi:MAG: hypothetical protein JKX69_06390 [Rhodobacteraceae bacterium]|nr:hypothetical protein [Paracoccaceae bacterium]